MPPLLISNLTNIRYLTGVRMTAGILLLSPTKRLLFADSRYTEKAGKEAKRGVKVLPLEEFPKEIKRLKSVQFEEDDLTVARLNRLRKKCRGTRFVPSSGKVEKMRRKKTLQERRSIEKACRITDKILRKIPSLLEPGITEKQVAWEIEKLAHEYGAEDLSFPAIVAFGDHSSRPHHNPTDRKLKKKDIIQIDMGVICDGYCSDCSRVFFKGAPTSEQKAALTFLRTILQEATAMAKAGTNNTTLDAYVRTHLKEKKYPDLPHALGHGIGLEVHECIILSSRSPRTRLITHEALAIEPAIYFSGKWGMRIEDTVLVTKSGGKRLTKVRY